jgi:hypothetical protein
LLVISLGKQRRKRMGNLNLDLDESVKSSEFTGSKEPDISGLSEAPMEIITEEWFRFEKDKIIQLSYDSIMHGYDLAIDILAGYSQSDAVKLLTEGRSALEVWLHNIKWEGRIEGNFGTESTNKDTGVTG